MLSSIVTMGESVPSVVLPMLGCMVEMLECICMPAC